MTNTDKSISLIRQSSPSKQFEFFLALLNNKDTIGVIVPESFDASSIKNINIPSDADFAVCSSGTKGKPKLLFRSISSWKDFIGEQNRIFNINDSSRVFIHGSLAFTGNLNIAVQAYYTNCYIYMSSVMKSRLWADEILYNSIDTVYMIPDKLYHLAKTGIIFNDVKVILCGSQFLTLNQYNIIHKAFPNARCFLYYGTSETSYISYKEVSEDNLKDCHNTGHIFPSVEVKINDENHILIKSPWCISGIHGFYDTGDTGYFKDNCLYLTGRSDDVINIHGQKINKSVIQQCLLTVPGIDEAEVTCSEVKNIIFVTAHIAGETLPEKIDKSIYNDIPQVFIPVKYIKYNRLPRNESGKVCINDSNTGN